MLNIVIPYRKDGNGGVELKYALRSIEKYLTGYKDIFIVGDKPPKWAKNLKHIHCGEESAKCARNILNKLIEATKHREVGDPFVQWQDDIYLTRPLHVKDIKYWYDGTLCQQIEKVHGRYHKIVLNTALELTGNEYYWDVHAPIIYKRGFLNLVACYPKFKEKDCLVKTTYCYTAQVEGEPMKDCKIHCPQPKGKIYEKAKDSLFFSNSSIIDTILVEVLNELYPDKSKYEL